MLTGVIESPDTLQLVARTYLKTLVWYILIAVTRNRKRKEREVAREDDPLPDDHVVDLRTEEATETDEDEPASPAFVFPSSASIDGVKLDEWPSSEESPEQPQHARIIVQRLVSEKQ